MGEEAKKEQDDLIQLSDQEQIRKERGLRAKEFMQGEFFLKFLLPFIEQERMGEYPNPSETGWEEKYRLAYAKDSVYAKLIGDIQSWSKEYEDLHKKERTVKKDIINA